jgi:hypothetical protein
MPSVVADRAGPMQTMTGLPGIGPRLPMLPGKVDRYRRVVAF